MRKRRLENCDFHRHHISLSEYRQKSRLEIISNYVPLFPTFIGNSQGFSLPRLGSSKAKEAVPTEDGYPLQVFRVKDQEPDPPKDATRTIVCEDWHNDMIKKGPS